MRWLPPALAAALFVAVYATDSNRMWFGVLNAWGPATSDFAWANITVLGDTLVALALCLPLWRRRPQLVWALAFAVVLGTAWVQGLKPLVDIARPPAVLETLHVIGPAYKAGSFPSGHATTAFAIAGLVALGLGSRAWAAAALVLATLVALSRAVVGVHWPLDILAGIFGGWLSAILALYLGRKTSSFGARPWVQWTMGLLLVLCAATLLADFKNDYPQADVLRKLIAVACLAAAGARLNRDFRRRPGL